MGVTTRGTLLPQLLGSRLSTSLLYTISHLLLPYSLRNGSMVMAKKIVFEIIADSDSTTLKT